MSSDPLPSSSSSSITKRIHISPLDPTTHTREALLSLLSPHASSVSLSSWPPKLNAVGQPRNYVHATMQGDEAKIKKAMARISGSVWKGTKLFLREAKKDYKGGYGSAGEGEEKKDGEAEEGSKKRKRKPAKPPRREHETIDSIITEADVKEGKVWGWKVTPAGYLLRPIQMRPEKPLPTPAVPSSSKSSSTSMRKIKQAAKKAQAAPPPSRARRQLIDPTRYGATHLGEALLGDEGVEAGHEVWVCEDLEGDEGEEGKVRWVRQGTDGVETEEFAVRPNRQVVVAAVEQEDGDDEQDEAMSPRFAASSPSPSSSSASSPSPSEAPASPSPIPSAAASPHLGPGNFSLTAYDPEEDDRWSDGYDEARGATAAGGADAAAGAADETARGMNLLKEMFGSGWKPAAVKAAAVVQQADAEDDVEHEEEEDEEEEDGEAGGAWWKKPARPTKAAKVDKKQATMTPTSAAAPVKKQTAKPRIEEEEPKAPHPRTQAPKTKAPAPQPPVEEKVEPESATPASKAEKKHKKQMQKAQDKAAAPVVELRAPQVAPAEPAATAESAAAANPSSAAPAAPAAIATPASTTSAPPVTATDASAVSVFAPPTAVSRRAALMAKMRQAAAASSSVGSHPTAAFAPVARFEPGVAAAATDGAAAAIKDAEAPAAAAAAAAGEGTSGKSKAPAATSSDDVQKPATETAPAVVEPTTVRMGSLKDMFKPQEGDGGFSLMGSLLGDEELELDEGVDFDAAADGGEEAAQGEAKEQEQGARPSTNTMHASRQAALSSSSHPSTTPSSSSFFFPQPSHTTTHSTINDDDEDDSIMLSFLRPDSEEQVRDKWEQRKTDLTQDYKRRHREAVKKSRRKGVGAVTGGRRGR